MTYWVFGLEKATLSLFAPLQRGANATPYLTGLL